MNRLLTVVPGILFHDADSIIARRLILLAAIPADPALADPSLTPDGGRDPHGSNLHARPGPGAPVWHGKADCLRPKRWNALLAGYELGEPATLAKYGIAPDWADLYEDDDLNPDCLRGDNAGPESNSAIPSAAEHARAAPPRRGLPCPRR